MVPRRWSTCMAQNNNGYLTPWLISTSPLTPSRVPLPLTPSRVPLPLTPSRVPLPLTPSPCRERGNPVRPSRSLTSFPLSTSWRGGQGERYIARWGQHIARGGPGVRTALHSPPMRTLRLLVVALLATWRLGTAQQASPYLPIHHWSTPYLEHFIARGVMADPTPLTRPWREADVLTVLGAMDTMRLSAGERRVVRRLTTELTHKEEGPALRADGDVGEAGATHARRDPLRAAG